jgi:PTS system N-acetylglucosamine-specific IIC component
MLFSMALTSFLTGVTEPIEFSFMFLAPMLYGIHAVLTGLAMALMNALNIHLGFGFSAGLFDYVLNYKQATQPLMLIPFGLVYFGLYYGLFRFFIVRFNLATPGREIEDTQQRSDATTQDDSVQGWIRGLGGAGNLVTVDACTTRLRLAIRDQSVVKEGALKALGARGFVRPSQETLQVVVGPIADQLASSIRAGLKLPVSTAAAATPISAPSTVDASVVEDMARGLIHSLGGASNIRELRLAASRVCFSLNNAVPGQPEHVSGVRAIARPAPDSLHVVAGPLSPALFAAVDRLRAGP